MADKTESEQNSDSATEPDVQYGVSLLHRLRWIPANMQRLAQLETSILSRLTASSVVRKSVRIGDGQQIWTLIARRLDSIRQTKSLSALGSLAQTAIQTNAHSASTASIVSGVPFDVSSSSSSPSTLNVGVQLQAQANDESEYERRIPIVLVHGMGSAASLFIKNIDALASRRVVYAFDLPGFGRSTRPNFSDDPEQVERQFVDSIENWRAAMNLDQFILLGHSLGGYLATSYTAAHPERVKHLILAEPWGFPRAPTNQDHLQQFPLIFRLLVRVVSPTFPFAVLRYAGPLGPSLVERFRPDLQRIYSDVVGDNTVLQYIYECNALEPSGENAFKSLCAELGWAKRPQIDRAPHLAPRVGITFIYGERSWIDSASGYLVRSMRPNSFVKVHVVPKAGHHVMAQCADEFNEIINRTCDAVDNNALDKLLGTPVTSQPSSKRPPSDGSGGSGSGNNDQPSEPSKRPVDVVSSSQNAERDHANETHGTDAPRQSDTKLHPRLNFFPANAELTPDLEVQIRQVSF